MGLIVLVTPLLIYYIIIIPIVKIGIINKFVAKKRSQAIWLIIALLLPLADHIIGYGIYKILCFTKGGVHIYKTVTDVEEQKAYWLNQYSPYVVSARYGSAYGLREIELITSDFMGHKTVYLNYCGDEKECEEAKKYIQKDEYKIYTNKTDSSKIPRKDNSKYIEGSPIKITWVATENSIEDAYLNYCNPQYDSLPKDDPNYFRSCKNANEIIKKYDLRNVVKVPKSPYSLGITKKSQYKVLPLLGVYEYSMFSINTETEELLSESCGYEFNGGWYIRVFNPYHPFFVYCRGDIHPSSYIALFNQVGAFETVIPNPYKNKKGN